MSTERIVVAAVAGLALGLSLFAILRPAPAAAPMDNKAVGAQINAYVTENPEVLRDDALRAQVKAYITENPRVLQDEAFGAQVKAYLMENPGVLFEAAAAYEQQEMKNAQKKIQDALAEHGDRIPDIPGQFYVGNPDAEITVVEFFDYHCTYCKAAMPTLMKLVEDNKDVRLRLMEFPILSRESEVASRAAIAASEQGKYLALHQAMMAARGSLGEERIFAIAQDVGLDLEQLKADMKSEKTAEVLKAHHDIAEQVGFDGTPGLIVGDKAMTGWHEPTILKYIAEQRKKKG